MFTKIRRLENLQKSEHRAVYSDLQKDRCVIDRLDVDISSMASIHKHNYTKQNFYHFFGTITFDEVVLRI
jgi:hypothetical protein